jgi:hypothetical protein
MVVFTLFKNFGSLNGELDPVKNQFGPSEVRATFLSSSTVIQNPRRGCRRVSNFCLGS